MIIKQKLLKVIENLESELRELNYLLDEIEQCEMSIDFASDMVENEDTTIEEKEKYKKELKRLEELRKNITIKIEEKLKY